MLRLPCAHCGNVEFLHDDGYYDDGSYYDEVVPVKATLDEEKILREEVDELRAKARKNRKRGRTYTLAKCPGFKHSRRDFGVRLIRRAYKVKMEIGCLPDKLQKRAEDLYNTWDENIRPSGWYPPVHTYITFDPRTGETQVLIGE